MDNVIVNYFITIGHLLGGELLSVILLLVLYGIILLLWKFLAKEGIYLYNILAVIIANIQVLKVTPFFLSSEPVALGTLLFSTTFLTSDILTEHYGVTAAKRGIEISFFAQIIMTILMIFTLVYPANPQDSVQAALYTLFAPSFRILIASLTSYYLCQWIDIKIFKALKDYTHKKLLWMRSIVSTMFSGFIDNCLFSALAWIVLNPNPVSLKTLIFTYILGTYMARVVVSITSTPVIYLTYKFFPKKK